jgi:calcineurin-like phosphoesterase family protein
MSRTWYWGDLHLGHKNIVKFTGKDGERIRPFSSIEEHDETLIENNNKVVRPEDRVYLAGDIAINRKAIPLIKKMNGRKKLIKGNHDIFKLKDYLDAGIEDIVSYRVYPEHDLLVSHIPVHTNQLERRFRFNLHGHLHSNLVRSNSLMSQILGRFGVFRPDLRYINICPEQTEWKPVDFDWVLAEMEKRASSFFF